MPKEIEGYDIIFETLKGFKPETSVPSFTNIVKTSKTFAQLKKDDIGWRLKARRWISIFCFTLLLSQNYFIFWLVYKAFHYDLLKDLSLVLGAIVTGTFAETAIVIKIIVQWVFTDINYDLKTEKSVDG